jgi:hypothetical protein
MNLPLCTMCTVIRSLKAKFGSNWKRERFLRQLKLKTMAYLRRDEKILRPPLPAGLVHQHVEDFSLIPRVHALIDLIHAPKRHMADVLQRQRVHRNGHRSFAARLHIPVQCLQPLLVAILDANRNAVVLVVVLLRSAQRHLARKSHCAHKIRKVLVDNFDDGVDLLVPHGVQLCNFGADLFQPRPAGFDLFPHFSDLHAPPFVVLDNGQILVAHQIETILNIVNSRLQLLEVAG